MADKNMAQARRKRESHRTLGRLRFLPSLWRMRIPRNRTTAMRRKEARNASHAGSEGRAADVRGAGAEEESPWQEKA